MSENLSTGGLELPSKFAGIGREHGIKSAMSPAITYILQDKEKPDDLALSVPAYSCDRGRLGRYRR